MVCWIRLQQGSQKSSVYSPFCCLESCNLQAMCSSSNSAGPTNLWTSRTGGCRQIVHIKSTISLCLHIHSAIYFPPLTLLMVWGKIICTSLLLSNSSRLCKILWGRQCYISALGVRHVSLTWSHSMGNIYSILIINTFKLHTKFCRLHNKRKAHIQLETAARVAPLAHVKNS